MKESGIVRPVDKLGRIVIPKELRRMLDVKNDIDSFEIFVEGDSLILKKYNPSCVFCSSDENCVTYNGQLVCKSCIEKLIAASFEGEEGAQ